MKSTDIGSATPQSGNFQWYAVQTRPRQEQRAEMNLAAWGVETLLPTIRPLPSRKGVSSAARNEALFPSYLFARFDVSTMAGKVRYTRGVAKILGTSAGPSSVDDAIIEEIRTRIGGDGCVGLSTPFVPGDRVMIKSGLLRNFEGVFQATAHPTQRLHLLLSAMYGQIRVTVDSDLVERVAEW